MTNKSLEDYLNSIDSLNSIEDLKSIIKKDIVWTEYNRTKGGMIAGWKLYDVIIEHPLGFRAVMPSQKLVANAKVRLLSLLDLYIDEILDSLRIK